jgi:uncharacterized protein GlcG (DUF336 family)
MKMDHKSTPGVCLALVVDSENSARRGPLLTISSGTRRTIAQESDKEWADAGHLQPTIRKSCMLLLSLLFAPLLAQAEAPMLIKIPRLTLEASERLAQATIAACRKEGIQIGVTVVDRSGDAMVFMRDTLAPRVTIEISRQKAYTAVNFNAPLSTMENRFTKPFAVGKVDGLVFSAGGIPISAAGNIVGAVGVSGAATGEQDEACAREGLQAIAFDLEMAGP